MLVEDVPMARVTAVFDDRTQAERAIAELRQGGISEKALDEARKALPYRYIVAASLTLLLAGLLIILLGGSREPVAAAPKAAVSSREEEPGEDD